jgi:hypothetical protein
LIFTARCTSVQIFGVTLGQTRLHRNVSHWNTTSHRSCPPARAARHTAALASGLRVGRGRAPSQGITRTEAALEVCATTWSFCVRRPHTRPRPPVRPPVSPLCERTYQGGHRTTFNSGVASTRGQEGSCPAIKRCRPCPYSLRTSILPG